MNSTEIERVLRRICGQKFIGVYPKDLLPRRIDNLPALMVVNTDKSGRPGEHWLAISIDKDGRGELFDSLATPPDAMLSNYMNRHTIAWTHSTRQLQSFASRYCGHYVVFYVAFRSLNYNLNRITMIFSHDTGLNDALIHSFVCRRLMYK